MKKTTLATCLVVLGLTGLSGAAVLAQEAAATPTVDTARRAKILDNLRFEFPQLATMSVTFESLEPSDFDGLDIGMLIIQGQQRQAFFISNDDSQFYFLGDGPFDLSRSSEELQAELAKRKEAEAKENAERIGQLDTLAADQPFRGDADGKVTIIEFSDFQCPYCSRAAATVEQILEKYNENVKVVYMNLPLVSIHPWAMGASIAAVCAADQDQAAFWKLHDGFFANQGSVNAGNLIDKASEWIADTGIDMDAWKTCSSDSSSESYMAAQTVVNDQMKLGQQLGVTGTPAFFVNGAFLNGAQPLESFVPLIDEILAD